MLHPASSNTTSRSAFALLPFRNLLLGFTVHISANDKLSKHSFCFSMACRVNLVIPSSTPFVRIHHRRHLRHTSNHLLKENKQYRVIARCIQDERWAPGREIHVERNLRRLHAPLTAPTLKSARGPFLSYLTDDADGKPDVTSALRRLLLGVYNLSCLSCSTSPPHLLLDPALTVNIKKPDIIHWDQTLRRSELAKSKYRSGNPLMRGMAASTKVLWCAD
jgi:hypothetical protein